MTREKIRTNLTVNVTVNLTQNMLRWTPLKENVVYTGIQQRKKKNTSKNHILSGGIQFSFSVESCPPKKLSRTRVHPVISMRGEVIKCSAVHK